MLRRILAAMVTFLVVNLMGVTSLRASARVASRASSALRFTSLRPGAGAARAPTCLFASKVSVRPTLDDVERISRGEAAKRRGTGSRAVPHRLNQMERKEWDLAKKRRYMLLRGSGYRKERGASPLANIYRQLCDAVGVVCITVARGVGNPPLDEVVVDFSPLRTTDVAALAQECLDAARQFASFQGSVDNSNVAALGWTEVEESLQVDVIWRIPVFSVVATFGDRGDSRRYAALLAQKYAGGMAEERGEGDDDDGDEGRDDDA